MPAIAAAVTLAVSLSSQAAGAAPVAVGLRFTAALQCGWPGPRVVVVFPVAERLPARMARAAVLVDGKPPASVARSGRTVTIAIARPPGVMCDVIAPAPVRVLFTRAAGIGNPLRAGTYALEATHGTTTARGSFTLR